MYKEFYLMKKEPFDSHPSPDLFYKSSAHKNGWSYLVNGIKTQEPILLLEGDYGAGKTLLYLKLIKLFNKNSQLGSVFVSTPTYSFGMVLEKIIEKLIGIPTEKVETSDESRLQQMIYEYFEDKAQERQNEFVYVVIDDAQEFSYSFVNKLRLFVSYNVAGRFPIRLILFAHHSFLKMLRYKKLVALGQRIKRVYRLKPLDFEETREYIYFRLIHSGASGTPVFDDDAISLIQTLSNGNPRLINNICDNVLLVASSRKCNLIGPASVQEAMENGGLMGLEAADRQGMLSEAAKGAPRRAASPAPPNQAQPARKPAPAPQPQRPAPQPSRPQPDSMPQHPRRQPAHPQPQPVHQASMQPKPVHQGFQPRQAMPPGNGMPGRGAHPPPFQPGQSQGAYYQQPQQAMPGPSSYYPPPGKSSAAHKPEKGKPSKGAKFPQLGKGTFKKGVVAVLIIIILFLLVYILNASKTKEEFNLQGSRYKITRQSPDKYFAIDAKHVLRQKEIPRIFINLPENGRKKEIDRFKPIVHMEKLM